VESSDRTTTQLRLGPKFAGKVNRVALVDVTKTIRSNQLGAESTVENLLYTNANSRGDFVQNALTGTARKDEGVFIATAFFTEYEVLRSISQRSGRIRLIVRLGFPTSPNALRRALNDQNVGV